MATRKLRTSGFARALLLSAGFLALESTVAFGTPSRLGNRALVFEENVGQTDPRVKFTARGPGYGLFLTSREMVLSLHREIRVSKSGPLAHDEKASRPEVLRMELVGGNPAPRISADGRLPETANYFLGNDPTKWRTGVATSSRVRYAQVYEGVDLVYYGNQRQLEYDLIVAPGSDPNRIRLAFRGAQRLELTSEGDLLLHTRGGTVRQKSPLIYQQIDGAWRLVAGGYRLKGKDRVGFDVGPYERSRPLVIDPVLSYSSYLAGTGEDWGTAIAVDSSGNAYVAGRTTSTIGFPTEAPFQSMFGGGRQDVFVTKFNAIGTRVYSTYLGGSGNDEIDGGLVVGADGSAYLAGTSDSPDFPTTQSVPGVLCLECHPANTSYGFLTRLHPSGSSLIFSVNLGNRIRRLSDLALDGGGNMYVTGQADEADPGAFHIGVSSPSSALAVKINPDASAIVYSTYLGGSSGEWCRAIAVDGSGSAYVTGATHSPDFPVLNSIVEADFNNCSDCFNGFVSKLNPEGTSLVYSTFLGGRPEPNAEEEGMGIAVDAIGQAYVTGYAYSISGFTALLGNCGRGQQFVMKLSATGDAFRYSTCIPGSSGFTPGGGISLDSAGNAYLAGVVDLLDDGQVAVNKINATGTQLAYSTTFGGPTTTKERRSRSTCRETRM